MPRSLRNSLFLVTRSQENQHQLQDSALLEKIPLLGTRDNCCGVDLPSVCNWSKGHCFCHSGMVWSNWCGMFCCICFLLSFCFLGGNDTCGDVPDMFCGKICVVRMVGMAGGGVSGSVMVWRLIPIDVPSVSDGMFK